MSNRPVRSQVIFGPQVIGAGTPITTIITGYRACGSLLPESVYFGHRDGGAGTTAPNADRADLRPESIQDAVIRLAGNSQDGIQTAGAFLARLAGRSEHDVMSVFTEASITDTAIPEMGTGADDGVETTSSTTRL